MVTRTATFGGALLVITGLLGFAIPGLMGMHLNTAHSFLFLFSGTAAIYFGLFTPHGSGRTFCIALGAFYGLLGLAGFVFKGLNVTGMIIPEALLLGTIDHLAHLVLGAIFLTVNWTSESGHRQVFGTANKY